MSRLNRHLKVTHERHMVPPTQVPGHNHSVPQKTVTKTTTTTRNYKFTLPHPWPMWAMFSIGVIFGALLNLSFTITIK